MDRFYLPSSTVGKTVALVAYSAAIGVTYGLAHLATAWTSVHAIRPFTAWAGREFGEGVLAVALTLLVIVLLALLVTASRIGRLSR